MNSPMEHFESHISKLPESANIILLLDPQKILTLDKNYISPDGKSWTVLNYCENDLVFRKEYASIQLPLIVWVIPKDDEKKIDITFIPDIIIRADSIVNMSLFALLESYTHSESWPNMIIEYSNTICKNFDMFLNKYKELRKEINKSVPLTKDHILALIISCQNPDISISDLVLWDKDMESVILRYLKLVWSHNMMDKKILNEIVRGYAPQDIERWIEKDPKTLAIYFYLEDIFKRYSVPNPKNQIRGIGIIPFDPEELKETDAILARIQNELLNKVSQIVEEELDLKDMRKVIKCIQFKTPEEKWDALLSEENPIFVSAISIEILNEIVDGKIQSIPPQKISSALLYRNEKTKDGLEILYYLVSIREILDRNFEPKEEITELIKWYIESRVYSMELFSARAYRILKQMYDKRQIYDAGLKEKTEEYIYRLKSRIREYLEKADLNLADLLEKDREGYLSSLATHILNFSKKKIQSKDRLWVLLFDGMRFDTWKEIVKPIIQTKFEIIDERSYLCVLPSVTEIARTALFAGATPDKWKDYDGKYTTNQFILAQKLFGFLSYREGKKRLNFVTRGESDITQRTLDDINEVKDYNIIIYNLSDDWIHGSKSDIADLNDQIKQMLENNILPDLNRIGEKDKVVIASDHGFIELLDEDAIKMTPYMYEDINQEIKYRYLKNIEHPEGVRISYKQGEFYTLAKGRRWFDRAGGRSDRYSHGGISLTEMVVPGVSLKKIVTPVIDLELEVPGSILGREDEILIITAKVTNKGNKPSDFRLSFVSNTGKESTKEFSLSPNSTGNYSFEVLALLNLKVVWCVLSYINTDKKQIKKKRSIKISVERRKDKVELGFGALDLLEDKS